MSSQKHFSVVEWLTRMLHAVLERPTMLALLMSFMIPIIMYGAQKSWLYTENRVEDWIPVEFEETQNLGKFMHIFGGDELMLITWEGCTLDSPQLAAFQKKLLEPRLVRDGRSVVLFEHVINGKEVFDLLGHKDFDLTQEDIYKRLEGYLISKDHTTTCLIALISEEGLVYRQEAVRSVWEIAETFPMLEGRMHVAGSTMDSVAIDDISRTYLIEMNLMSYLIGIVISYFCFMSLRVALTVFFISFLNQQICLALIFYLGIPFGSVLMLSVNLMFVLSMSAGIHLVHYYRETIRHLPPKEAVYRAVSTAIVPTFISILTTICGLLSFLSSQLVPIRSFGELSAGTLGVSIVILMIYIPLSFLLFPVRQWHEGMLAPGEKPKEEEDGFLARGLTRLFFYPVKRFAIPIIILSLISAVFFGIGATRIQTRIGLHSMLRSDTRPIKDYTWIEENFGPMIPVEVMIILPEGDAQQMLHRLVMMEALAARVKETLPDTQQISLLNFLPNIPSGGGGGETGRRWSIVKRIWEHREDLVKSGYFVEKEVEIDGKKQMKQFWRLTVRTYAMRKTDYGPILAQIHRDVDGIFAESMKSVDGQPPVLAQKPDFIVTGGVPVVYRAQSQLLLDLKNSFLTAFLIIGVILIVLFRSFRCGIYALFPSLLPCVIVFGIVGWLGVQVEIGTMLTGSAALAISVDNTVHFITWYQIGHRQGLNRADSVLLAYRKCGVAMCQTAAVCSFGLVTYMISPFIPMIYFSFFMFSILMMSLVCDLLITPAILMLRAGDLFLKGTDAGDKLEKDEEAAV